MFTSFASWRFYTEWLALLEMTLILVAQDKGRDNSHSVKQEKDSKIKQSSCKRTTQR